MIDKNKWIQDPENPERFFSVKKNIGGKHIVAKITLFEYKPLKDAYVSELPTRILEVLKKTRPEAVGEASKVVSRSMDERELEKIRGAIKRLTGNGNGTSED